MIVHIPIWVLVAAVCWAVAVVVAHRDAKSCEGTMFAVPVLAPLALAAAVIATLALWICHLQNWLWL